jgi:hypothetical protein
MRKILIFTFLILFLCSFGENSKLFCAEENQQGMSSQDVQSGAPVYVPPFRGAPSRRIGGGSRSLEVNKPYLTVIAPDHTGFTIQEQPTIYWYISESSTTTVEFTMTTEKGDDRFIEIKLPATEVSGLQRFSLKEHNVRLAPNVEYKWYVSIVPDPKRRSKDIIAGGSIMRISLNEKLKQKLDKASTENIFYVLAEEGIWYDTIQSLSGLIEKYPGNKSYKSYRAKLFGQVGLTDISE